MALRYRADSSGLGMIKALDTGATTAASLNLAPAARDSFRPVVVDGGSGMGGLGAPDSRCPLRCRGNQPLLRVSHLTPGIREILFGWTVPLAPLLRIRSAVGFQVRRHKAAGEGPRQQARLARWRRQRQGKILAISGYWVGCEVPYSKYPGCEDELEVQRTTLLGAAHHELQGSDSTVRSIMNSTAQGSFRGRRPQLGRGEAPAAMRSLLWAAGGLGQKRPFHEPPRHPRDGNRRP